MELLNEIWNWFKTHWAEILTFAGIGSGSAITGKKYIDRKQNDKLDNLAKRVTANEKNIRENKAEIERVDQKVDNNGERDQEFKQQVKADNERIYRLLEKMESKQDANQLKIEAKQDSMMDKIYEIAKSQNP